MHIATSAEVGIRDLKNNLSAWIDRVRAGERVVVTDRGRPVATLVPVDSSIAQLSDLVAAGLVRPPIQSARFRPTTRIKPAGPISDLVADQRR